MKQQILNQQSSRWAVFGTLGILTTLALSLQAQSVVLGPSNGGFESGNTDWFSGGTGGAAGSVTLPDNTSNGPSAPGSFDLLITSDGTGNADFRAATFSLGSAANGLNPVTFSFDYNILGTVTPGSNIRVGLRTWSDSGGSSFQGEQNFFIGDTTGDSGASGWETFIGTYTPSSTALYADLRISMNVFNPVSGGDHWTDGSVLFDNFQVTTVPEPSSLALLSLSGGLGLVLLRAFRTNRRTKS